MNIVQSQLVDQAFPANLLSRYELFFPSFSFSLDTFYSFHGSGLLLLKGSRRFLIDHCCAVYSNFVRKLNSQTTQQEACFTAWTGQWSACPACPAQAKNLEGNWRTPSPSVLHSEHETMCSDLLCRSFFPSLFNVSWEDGMTYVQKVLGSTAAWITCATGIQVPKMAESQKSQTRCRQALKILIFCLFLRLVSGWEGHGFISSLPVTDYK